LADRARGQDHRPEDPQLHLRLQATTDVVHAPPGAGDAPDAVAQAPQALGKGTRHGAGPPTSTLGRQRLRHPTVDPQLPARSPRAGAAVVTAPRWDNPPGPSAG
jgi:hypothetical protein